MDPISEALQTEIPLSASLLSQLAKGPLRDGIGGVDPQLDVDRCRQLWQKLVLTARSPQVTDKHITPACNALCVFLNAGLASPRSGARELVVSWEFWFDAFHCAHRAFNDGKSKPCFQLMETLCDVLRAKAGSSQATAILADAALPLVSTVLLASPRVDVKKACLMLSCLLRRTAVADQLPSLVTRCVDEHASQWSRRLWDNGIAEADLATLGGGPISLLVLSLVSAMLDLDTRSAALKLCSLMCHERPDAAEPSSTPSRPSAEDAIHLFLARNHAARGDFVDNVLPVMLPEKERYLTFLQRYAHRDSRDDAQTALFLAALKVGRQKKILSESEVLAVIHSVFPQPTSEYTVAGQREYVFFTSALRRASGDVRLFSLRLLTTAPSSNSTIPVGVLQCLASNLPYLYDDADAHERSEILSVIRRFLRRVQTSSAALQKSAIPDGLRMDAAATLSQYESTIRILYRFLKGELRSGASYTRHILGLQTLECLYTIFPDLDVACHDLGLFYSLCSLVLDPFEDVRSTASSLIQRLVLRNPAVGASVLTPSFIQRMEVLARDTGRADHADALARLLALRDLAHASGNGVPALAAQVDRPWLPGQLDRLEQALSIRGSLKPGCNLPVHGVLLAIRYRLANLDGPEAPPAVIAQSLRICRTIWAETSVQLCVDSPETATALDLADGSPGPKDLLAYSWRALRDSSLVLQSLLLASKPDIATYGAIGSLCMEQLVALRHRGAFSTVALTFNLCCDNIRAATDPDTRGLLSRWYAQALQQVIEQADRLTRRSAGLPAMITALLSPSDQEIFSGGVQDLMDIARRPVDPTLHDKAVATRLPQVHALNCLKEIMTNSKFAVAVGQFMPHVLRLAASCLSSKIWAIRNCGLMLLRACIGRLDSWDKNLGPTLSRDQGEVSQDSVSEIAVRLLDASVDAFAGLPESHLDITEQVFTALDLLGHASESERSDAASQHIIRHLANSHWAIRDQAALLLAQGASELDLATAFRDVMTHQQWVDTSNGLHGCLICGHHLLASRRQMVGEKEIDELTTVIRQQSLLLDRIQDPRTSPYVKAAFLDLLNAMAAILFNRGGDVVGLFQRHFSVSFRESITTPPPAHDSYLMHRILLYRIYETFARDSANLPAEEQWRPILADLVNQLGFLDYILGHMAQHHGDKSHPILVDFLICLLKRYYRDLLSRPNTLHLALSCLTQALEHLTNTASSTLPMIDGLFELDALKDHRDLWTEALKLEGYLLGLHSSPGGPVAPEMGQTARGRVEDWVHSVQLAAADYLDLPTRMGAAKSLTAFYGSRHPHQDQKAHPVNLDLLLILYHLLNDDDEDIRAEAVGVASFLQGQGAGTSSDTFCALACREKHLDSLIQTYGRKLAGTAVLNLLQVGHLESSCHLESSGPFTLSVTQRLNVIREALNDLFAEERQNLYIDDLREIQAWKAMAETVGLALWDPAQLTAAVEWTSEGLDQIAVVIRSSTQSLGDHAGSSPAVDMSSVHPLGATYHHDVLVVCLQVVSLASLLLGDQQDMRLGLHLRLQLEKLKTAGVKVQANEILMDAVDRALARE